VPDGPLSIVVVGPVVTTFQLRVAVLPTLPTPSVARTAKLWEPSVTV
jgi:hypothetical protein